jgi:hypothetical protein
MASFHRYTLRIPGITLTQAASLFSTNARATRCASSAEAQVLSTTILSVIVSFFDVPLDLLAKEDYKRM